MTQLRFHPGSISNYFDTVLHGIGKRGSSFSDIDAVSHDLETHRFLVQEFKREDEPMTQGQHWMLKDLAAIPKHFTVWHIVRRTDGMIGFATYGQAMGVISVTEYQDRFRRWWNNEPVLVSSAALLIATQDRPEHARLLVPLTAADIKW